MPSFQINTQEEYHKYLNRLSLLMDASEDDSEAMVELDQLATALETYEKKAFPIALPSLLEAIQFRLEQISLNPAEIEEIFGTSDVKTLQLNGNMDKSLIQKIHTKLDIPPEIILKGKR